jgi:DNA-binding LacI/PurR family transcriptional regulator
VLLAASARGIAVPANLLVADCTDSDTAKLTRPSLTVLDLNPAEVGSRAVELLIDLVENRRPAHEAVVVRTALLPRGSRRRPSARAKHPWPRPA